VIRCYDLETGKDQIFEGHKSWVLCLATYQTETENWLLSGSDDQTIRIWDAKTTKVLEELTGHHNGVTCLTFANNELFSGSQDHYIICWDIDEITQRIKEKQLMLHEDLLSRRLDVFYKLTMKKKKKGKKGKGKGKKGKK